MIPKSSLYSLLMKVPAAICIVRGPEHVFEFANPLYQQLFNSRDLIGKPARQALLEIEGQGYFEILDRVYQTGEPFVGTESPAKLDRETTFNFIYQPTFLEDGSVEGIMALAFDVTELVQARRQAEALAESLQRANREKDDFIAVISHELRTPLTAILGWARMLQLGGLDDETYHAALDAIERSTKAQSQLIEDLLDESRIAAGKLRLSSRPLRLKEVVEAAVEAIAPSAENKGVRLESEISSEPMIVRGDPNRLQQIVTNLISNAVKFTNNSGVVSVKLMRQDARALIQVMDTGCGIRPSFLPYVFDRFRQDENTTDERRSGLGLGLSITRHLVEQHGGTVHAASEGVGKGATFTVELPLFMDAEAISQYFERDGSDRYSSLPSLKHVKVLVIEDESDNRDVLAAVLLRCEAEVATAITAAEVVEKVRTWRPDVILSDIILPRADGCELLQNVRTLPDDQGGRTPAIALTVHGRPDERLRAAKAGFAIFRQKPIEPADLAFDVARLADRQTVPTTERPQTRAQSAAETSQHLRG